MLTAAAGGAALFDALAVLGLYFVPTIVAKVRGVPNFGSIVAVNLLLGFTLIGWFVALTMARRPFRRRIFS
jgi:hypothetical protein